MSIRGISVVYGVMELLSNGVIPCISLVFHFNINIQTWYSFAKDAS